MDMRTYQEARYLDYGCAAVESIWKVREGRYMEPLCRSAGLGADRGDAHGQRADVIRWRCCIEISRSRVVYISEEIDWSGVFPPNI
jgi:hypothetical protein